MKHFKLLLYILPFLFINVQTSAQLDCAGTPFGFFEYDPQDPTSEGTEDAIIYRDKDAQIEYMIGTDIFIFMEIKWNDRCNYSLSVRNTNDSNPGITKIDPLEVQITQSDDRGYNFLVTNEEYKISMTGRIIHLEKEVSPAILKKVKKTFKQNKRKFL